MTDPRTKWIDLVLECSDCGVSITADELRRLKGRCGACHDKRYRPHRRDTEDPGQLQFVLTMLESQAESADPNEAAAMRYMIKKLNEHLAELESTP